MRTISRTSLLLIFICLVIVFPGCQDKERRQAEQVQMEKSFYQPFTEASAIPMKQVELPDYRLNVGDQLEIIFHVKILTPDEYRLHTEDILTIKFPYHPTYDQTVTITPDGKIRLLLIGEVTTYVEGGKSGVEKPGKTVGQIEKEIRERYSKYFKDSDLTVTFKAANIKIEELKRAITTAPRGQSRLMPVKPDGKITLPYIGDTRAYGKTIEELRADLNRRYAEEGIPELEVTVQILSVAPRKIYVFGEVERPGLIEAGNMITLTQALAMAGGYTTRGDAAKVLVIRRKDMPIAEGVIVDVDYILNATVKYQNVRRPDPQAWVRDFWLEDYDVVYVPPSRCTKSNDWINQVFTRGIFAVMPFSTSVGLGFGYQIRQAPTTIRTDNGNPFSSVVANAINNQLTK